MLMRQLTLYFQTIQLLHLFTQHKFQATALHFIKAILKQQAAIQIKINLNQQDKDGNNQVGSSTTDADIHQTIIGNNNVQKSEVTEKTNIVQDNPVSDNPANPQPVSSSGLAPPAGIKATAAADDDSSSSTINVFEIIDPSISDIKPQVESPTEAPTSTSQSSAPLSDIEPDSTKIGDSTIPSNKIEEIAIAESKQIYPANQSSNTNPVQPQPGYQQPTSTDNKLQITNNIAVVPTTINKQETSYQQTQYQTVREQGNLGPELYAHDIIYNNSPVDNTSQDTPIYNTHTLTPIYNTPSSTPISNKFQTNNGEQTEIIIEEIKKPSEAYPYIHEMEFSGSGDIMNYFDMKQISGVPNSHGGFNSYQSCTKNVYDKDVQTLKNELNTQQITLDRIVASLKKCNCYCVV
ncbi:hypothetical protein LSTR_LSTR004215 [Laodelphax striatellus]|uniref:Uncharacterized protein n=1 Tax=Laodelphax striatellus TaxID=195883 RepID=A0A482X9M3_LAOST|nr:hypothetical protein LSTR_LSTR004215 [Laodelphax striatellus]